MVTLSDGEVDGADLSGFLSDGEVLVFRDGLFVVVCCLIYLDPTRGSSASYPASVLKSQRQSLSANVRLCSN